jgi:DNA excision repair protein ERCC-4
MTETEQLANPFGLPALVGLGELAGKAPVIVVDTREQDPLAFERLESSPGTLTTGDYSIRGLEHLFAIERKTVPDLVGCCMRSNRERFERELHRLRGFRFKRLLVIGSEREIRQGVTHSRINPASVLATLNAFEMRYDLPVVFCPTAEIAARKIETWAFWFAREVVEAVNNLYRSVRD